MSDERFSKRFNGREAFAGLTEDQRAEIGGIALELVVTWNGQEAYCEGPIVDKCRPFEAADPVLLDMLHEAVNLSIPDVISAEPLPVPSLLGGVCRRCGCSEEDACFPSCGWAEHDLCTACAGASEL